MSERSAEQSEPKIGWSRAKRSARVAEKRWSGAGGRGAGTELGAEVTGVGARSGFSPLTLR